MKQRYTGIITILIMVLSAKGQNSFLRTYGGTGNELFNKVAETNDKGLFLAGESASFTSLAGAYLVRTDVDGVVIWQKSYQFGTDPLTAVTGFVDGNSYAAFCVAGDRTVNNGKHYILAMKLDANGDTLFTKTYNQLNFFDHDFNFNAAQLKVISGGYVYSGYYLDPADSLYKSFYGRMDAQLNLISYDVYASTENVKAYSVCSTTDKGIAFTGEIFKIDSMNTDGVLVKIDSLNASPFIRKYGGKNEDAVYSISELSSGNLVLAGVTSSYSGIGQDSANAYMVVADKDGNELFYKTYGGMSMDVFIDVKPSSDGGFIITGASKSLGTGNGTYDSYLIKVDNAGSEQWYKTFGAGMEDAGNSVIETTDGGFVLAGYINDDLQQPGDALVVKTLSNGYVSLAGIGTVAIPEKELAVYPNPFTDKVFIVLPEVLSNSSSEKILAIYDVLGNVVKRFGITGHEQVITIQDNFMPGVYTYRLALESGNYTGKLIVKE